MEKGDRGKLLEFLEAMNLTKVRREQLAIEDEVLKEAAEHTSTTHILEPPC